MFSHAFCLKKNTAVFLVTKAMLLKEIILNVKHAEMNIIAPLLKLNGGDRITVLINASISDKQKIQKQQIGMPDIFIEMFTDELKGVLESLFLVSIVLENLSQYTCIGLIKARSIF